MRPGAERRGSHGLFTESDEPIILYQVANEVACHPGNVWSHVVSLRREDAIRLGFVKVHQNEDKSLELTFELNGSFEDSATAFVGEENETGILIDYNAPEGFYKDMFGIDVS